MQFPSELSAEQLRAFMHQPAHQVSAFLVECGQRRRGNPPSDVLFADGLSAEEAEAYYGGGLSAEEAEVYYIGATSGPAPDMSDQFYSAFSDEFYEVYSDAYYDPGTP